MCHAILHLSPEGEETTSVELGTSRSPTWQREQHSRQVAAGRFSGGPATPGARCPKETLQAMGFACFNGGLGEMWIESPEIH